MPSSSVTELLDRLDEARLRFGKGCGALVARLLDQLARRKFLDADSLIRFHEMLLFICAYPHDAQALKRAENLLASFDARVQELRRKGADMSAFDFMEYSGISGTNITGKFSYAVVRWLVERYNRQVSIAWEDYKAERLGLILPQLLPLLYEESLVEANIPFREWLSAAQRREGRELHWLVRRIDELPRSEEEKAALYDSMELWVRWEIDDSSITRTNMRRTPRKIFYQRGPLIRRNEVSLAEEMSARPIPLRRLSPASGKAVVEMLRASVAVRYRELYGITHGDARQVVHAHVGRGVEIFLWGLPIERRLPLRAYHAGFTLKNGVPINYIEGISLFDRMELGFNMFYTYRDGESAWIYAQALRLLHQTTGVTCFSVDPYQIGFNNDEAIDSGAFWFYRKLGFRPTMPELLRLTETEERKISEVRGYRSAARTLRRLSKETVVYEMPGTPFGYWDRFRIRNLGFAVERGMASRFGSDPAKMLRASKREVSRALKINPSAWPEALERAFDNLALVLSLIPDLSRWTETEKKDVVAIIRAKAGRDESLYLRLLQRHARLRDAIRKLGSSAR